VARLQRHAAFMADDLVRTLDGEWMCNVSDEYVLRVIGPRWEGVVEIDQEVDQDEEDDEVGPDVDLDADACEAVIDQVLELMGNALIDGPACPDHAAVLVTRDGVWICDDGGHEVAQVGQLAAR
jgi:hypothetical protein